MITTLLIAIGIVMIYSSSAIPSWERYGDSMYFLKRHLVFLLIGLIASFSVMILDYRILQKYSRILLIGSLGLLVLVLVPGIGKEVSGAQRWFRIAGFGFQPSELAHFCLIIYIADFLVRKENFIRDFWHGFIPSMFVLGIAVLLLLMQPDLGSSIAMALVVILMLFIGGLRISHLVLVSLVSLPALAYLVFSVPYRRARILAFLNPWQDPKGTGFQIIQSQIALGSGGLFGVGLGQGKQKLFYLPAAHTDFIFSIIGEELGLFFTLAIVILFILFLMCSIKIIKNIKDRFGYFLAVGILSTICLKAIINIGVSIGFFPTKGLPLPFISYGGSSLVFDMIGVALLLNISRFTENI